MQNLRLHQPPTSLNINREMTLLTASNVSIMVPTLPLKTDSVDAKQPELTNREGYAGDGEAVLQSSNKKRRYQRRGSKSASMMLFGIHSRMIHLDDTCLVEIQRRLLADKDLLLSLELADARDDQMANCTQQVASIDLIAQSALVGGKSDKKRALYSNQPTSSHNHPTLSERKPSQSRSLRDWS